MNKFLCLRFELHLVYTSKRPKEKYIDSLSLNLDMKSTYPNTWIISKYLNDNTSGRQIRCSGE